jgi:16S rRNA G1207 methylase RsmC
MKLTMTAAKAHQRARDLLATQRPLTMEEREFVLRHWQESQNSTTVTTLAGAFFTPLDLAKDVALHVSGAVRLIDLGAGIGALAWAAYRKVVAGYLSLLPVEIVCVERNPEYVAVGRRVLPEAEWICADLFALPADLCGIERDFDVVISNPPFGRTPRSGRGPRYTGPPRGVSRDRRGRRSRPARRVRGAADLRPGPLQRHSGPPVGSQRGVPAVRRADRH